MADEKKFRNSLSGKSIPLLVLDQKWHKLFDASGKPEPIQVLEKCIDEYLSEQARTQADQKDLRKLKTKLMNEIVESMDSAEDNADKASDKKMAESKRLIEEINEKIAASEDDLLDIPYRIKKANEELMLLTMEYCYNKLRANSKEVDEITLWVVKIKQELKKNLVVKQAREVNTRFIYHYLHDIFGGEIMDIFDLENGDLDLSFLNPMNRDEEAQGIVKEKSESLSDSSPKKKENFDA